MDTASTARPGSAGTGRFLGNPRLASRAGNPGEAWALQFRGSDGGRALLTCRQVAISRLLEALDFAAIRHSAQRRKGPDAAPYVNHLIEVASLVANVGRVDDEDVLIAAVLHDVLEDTPTTATEVEERFGSRVLRFVQALSDDKSLPRRRRREITLQELPQMEVPVHVIKLADLASNIKLLPPNWTKEHQLEYLEWSECAATICGPSCQALADLYWERASLTRAKLEASAEA